jgi:hypothetical protein
MVTINSVNFDDVIRDAIKAANAIATENWEQIRDIVENIANGLVNDVEFIAKKKLQGEFNEDDARVYLEDQKMLARVRLRSIAIITLQIAERIWNAVAEIFRSAIKTALGWTII